MNGTDKVIPADRMDKMPLNPLYNPLAAVMAANGGSGYAYPAAAYGSYLQNTGKLVL